MTGTPKFGMFGVGETPDPTTIGTGPKKPLPPEFKNVKAFLKHNVKYVHDFWLGDPEDKDPEKQFRPMMIAVCQNGDIVPVLAVMSFDEDEKQQYADQMRTLFKLWKVERYCFISEAWLGEAVFKGGKKREDLRPGVDYVEPSKQEGRKEVMTIMVADKKGHKGFKALEMIRDWETGLVTKLEPIEELFGMKLGDGEMFTGRFSNLLEDIPPPKHPAEDEENMEQIGRLRAMCLLLSSPMAPPDIATRLGGQDKYIALRNEGIEFSKRIDDAFKAMAAQPVGPGLGPYVDDLNKLMREAQEYATRVAFGILGDKAKEIMQDFYKEQES